MQTTQRALSTNTSESKSPEEEESAQLIHHPTCIFCKILKGEIPCSTVYEDETCRIIMDIHPIRRGHVLIIPRRHYKNIMDMPPEVSVHMIKLAHQMTAALTKGNIAEFKCDGTNLLWNNGRAAWQTVMHAHLHLIPRQKGDSLGFVIGFICHFLSLIGIMPAAKRPELDRLAGIFGDPLTKHIKSS